MTQEEKRLLLKDLCGRALYGVKVWRQGADYVVSCIDIEKQRIYLKADFEAIRGWWWDIEEVKPYLRPMESMTEEEKKEVFSCISNGWETTACKEIDWLNAHHFDYRGLIPMGLALDAKKGMYNY